MPPHAQTIGIVLCSEKNEAMVKITLLENNEAIATFERMLRLNPNDNQGARFCLFDARDGVT